MKPAGRLLLLLGGRLWVPLPWQPQRGSCLPSLLPHQAWPLPRRWCSRLTRNCSSSRLLALSWSLPGSHRWLTSWWLLPVRATLTAWVQRWLLGPTPMLRMQLATCPCMLHVLTATRRACSSCWRQGPTPALLMREGLCR